MTETKLERDDARVHEKPEHDEESEIQVPWDQLSPEALRGVIKEFVTREGTDYGHTEVPFEDKLRQVQRQLEMGEVLVLFDAKAETINLVTKRDFERR